MLWHHVKRKTYFLCFRSGERRKEKNRSPKRMNDDYSCAWFHCVPIERSLSVEFHHHHFSLLLFIYLIPCHWNTMQLSYTFAKRWTSSRKSFKTNNILRSFTVFSFAVFIAPELCTSDVNCLFETTREHHVHYSVSFGRAAASERAPIWWRVASLFRQKVHKPNWRIAFENSFSFILLSSLFRFFCVCMCAFRWQQKFSPHSSHTTCSFGPFNRHISCVEQTNTKKSSSYSSPCSCSKVGRYIGVSAMFSCSFA